MLAEHPNVLKRLREEILEKVGDTRLPTFDDMKDMKYLRAVINETIRLYPAVYVPASTLKISPINRFPQPFQYQDYKKACSFTWKVWW